MQEQLGLFDDSNKRIEMDYNLVDSDFNHITDKDNIVQHNFKDWFTKEELKDIVRKSTSSKKYGPYGFECCYKENGNHYRMFIRFDNYTTSKRDTAIDHINKYFDESQFLV